MKRRSPQLTLRLDTAAASDPLAAWHDGASIAYLGGRLRLRLATGQEAALRSGSELLVTLPPEATPRQIRDLCEAWLREEATRLIAVVLERETARRAGPLPRWRLSFASDGHWARFESDGVLRIHWRLIEQAATMMDQVIARALAAMPRPAPVGDLFSAVPVPQRA